MLTALVLIAAGAGLGNIPAFQDAFIGAATALMAVRLFLVLVEHRGDPLSDVHRRRVEALWLVIGAGVGGIAYLLL